MNSQTFSPEVEKTLKRLRRQRNAATNAGDYKTADGLTGNIVQLMRRAQAHAQAQEMIPELNAGEVGAP